VLTVCELMSTWNWRFVLAAKSRSSRHMKERIAFHASEGRLTAGGCADGVIAMKESWRLYFDVLVSYGEISRRCICILLGYSILSDCSGLLHSVVVPFLFHHKVQNATSGALPDMAIWVDVVSPFSPRSCRPPPHPTPPGSLTTWVPVGVGAFYAPVPRCRRHTTPTHPQLGGGGPPTTVRTL
jgi:hypothetical protein